MVSGRRLGWLLYRMAVLQSQLQDLTPKSAIYNVHDKSSDAVILYYKGFEKDNFEIELDLFLTSCSKPLIPCV